MITFNCTIKHPKLGKLKIAGEVRNERISEATVTLRYGKYESKPFYDVVLFSANDGRWWFPGLQLVTFRWSNGFDADRQEDRLIHSGIEAIMPELTAFLATPPVRAVMVRSLRREAKRLAVAIAALEMTPKAANTAVQA